MSEYVLEDIKQTFSRLFVAATEKKMHLSYFTNVLAKSDYVRKIEQAELMEIVNIPFNILYQLLFDDKILEETGYGVFNDAYWSGHSYFELFLLTHRPFSYIFLKLPLEKMLDVYSIFHEMDFSALLQYFKRLETENTILRLLCKEKGVSLNELSQITGISSNTLKKYNASDAALYKASFQHIYKLSRFFNVSISLFAEIL